MYPYCTEKVLQTRSRPFWPCWPRWLLTLILTTHHRNRGSESYWYPSRVTSVTCFVGVCRRGVSDFKEYDISEVPSVWKKYQKDPMFSLTGEIYNHFYSWFTSRNDYLVDDIFWQTEKKIICMYTCRYIYLKFL